MTTFESAIDATAVMPRAEDQPIRRTRALRLTVLPSFHTVAQLAGAGIALYGTYLKFGSAVAMIAAGVLVVAVSMLREGGKI
jgi:hypothetical protein